MNIQSEKQKNRAERIVLLKASLGRLAPERLPATLRSKISLYVENTYDDSFSFSLENLVEVGPQ